MFKRLLGSLALTFVVMALMVVIPTGSAFAAAHAMLHSEDGHTSQGVSTQTARTTSFAGFSFNVTIQGNIDQAVSFKLPAQLLVVPAKSPGSLHPFDLCLDVGSQILPYSNPVTGAITLDSNSGCFQGFDVATYMGSVSYNQSTGIAIFQVDPNASSLGVNAFNTSGGIAGGVELVVAGTMQLRFTHNSTTNFVQGEIHVVGNESPYSPTQGDIYTATISGSTN
jgi:hypothetical protein